MIAKLRSDIPRRWAKKSEWPPEFASRLQTAYFSAHRAVFDATGCNRLAIIGATLWVDRFLAALALDPDATRPELATAACADYPVFGDDDALDVNAPTELDADAAAALAELIADARATELSADDERWIADTTLRWQESQLESVTKPRPNPLE